MAVGDSFDPRVSIIARPTVSHTCVKVSTRFLHRPIRNRGNSSDDARPIGVARSQPNMAQDSVASSAGEQGNLRTPMTESRSRRIHWCLSCGRRLSFDNSRETGRVSMESKIAAVFARTFSLIRTAAITVALSCPRSCRLSGRWIFGRLSTRC